MHFTINIELKVNKNCIKIIERHFLFNKKMLK